jgi:hypothetical protein
VEILLLSGQRLEVGVVVVPELDDSGLITGIVEVGFAVREQDRAVPEALALPSATVSAWISGIIRVEESQ